MKRLLGLQRVLNRHLSILGFRTGDVLISFLYIILVGISDGFDIGISGLAANFEAGL